MAGERTEGMRKAIQDNRTGGANGGSGGRKPPIPPKGGPMKGGNRGGGGKPPYKKGGGKGGFKKGGRPPRQIPLTGPSGRFQKKFRLPNGTVIGCAYDAMSGKWVSTLRTPDGITLTETRPGIHNCIAVLGNRYQELVEKQAKQPHPEPPKPAA